MIYYINLFCKYFLAVEKFTLERGYDPSIAIALDTKGPEIRTGILEGDDGRKEVTLEMGAQIKITTDDQYKEKCSQKILWVDYKNINKVLSPGKRIFIDDGLISVIVTEIGKMIWSSFKIGDRCAISNSNERFHSSMYILIVHT